VSAEQRVFLYEAFSSWPGLRITNHGFEWVDTDSDQTAQQIAVVIQAQARVLQRLKPVPKPQPKPSTVERMRSRMPKPSVDRLRQQTSRWGRPTDEDTNGED
jgi:hypothetical protein